MKYRQIGVGTKIELDLFDKGEEKICAGLVSQFESYDEINNMMEIHVPFSKGMIYTVQPGILANVIFLKDNDTYMFKAEIIDRKKTEPIPMLYVKPVSPIEKIERRSFFRMESKLPVLYHVVEPAEANNDEEVPLKKCHTRDISGGGVCLVTDEAYAAGTKIHAYLKLDREIGFVGTVVRATQTRERGKIVYEIGIEFKQIENRDREKIISYIFEKQRERIRKGMKP